MMVSASCPARADRVRLFTRHGTDFTPRFLKIAAAVASLPARSCVLDGEAIVVNEHGLAVLDTLRGLKRTAPNFQSSFRFHRFATAKVSCSWAACAT